MSFEQKYVDNLKKQRNGLLDANAELAARLSICEEEKEAMKVVVAELEKQIEEADDAMEVRINALRDQVIKERVTDKEYKDPHG